MNTSPPILQIKNLKASVDNTVILKGVNLVIHKGEVHTIMGPNGSGKSTLSKLIAGHQAYQIIEGEILFNGINLLELEPEERAHLGLFLGFQYPLEIPGVSNADFLRLAYNIKQKNRGLSEIDPLKFLEIINQKLEIVGMDHSFLSRNVNEGFSGGEKKRNEILQMALLEPLFSILDETDSGLDIDALKIIAKGINSLKRDDNAILLITHYQRLLNYITPNFVHIMENGQIIKTGDFELAKDLEREGYEGIKNRVRTSI
uniref:Probable ATP-dependent transporter ycf16 n=1 Tax=Sciadococcus taiwanensis TaxID=3028030 RepID=A0A9Y1I263_9RHOD|nr:sulfate ABC transporter protein [Sciadococcus taiwanensis]